MALAGSRDRPGPARTGAGHPEPALAELAHVGPHLLRVMLGDRLRRLHEGQSIGRKQAADTIRGSDVVYIENLAQAIYPETPAEIRHYWHLMNTLATHALSADDTMEFVRQILSET